MAGKVFLSYRRGETSQVAGRLRDRLVETFGQPNVFFDVDSIAYGEDFRQAIANRLSQVDVAIVLIGDDWDVERLSSPRDWVRVEVTEALRQSKHVTPVLVDGAPMPREDQLPDEMRELVYRSAAPLRPDPDFHTDASRLIESLQESISQARGSTAAERRTSTQTITSRVQRVRGDAVSRERMLLAGGLALVVIALVVVLTSLSAGDDTQAIVAGTTTVASGQENSGDGSGESAQPEDGKEVDAPVDDGSAGEGSTTSVFEPTDLSADGAITQARSRFQGWMSVQEPGVCPDAAAELDRSDSYPLLDDESLDSVFFEAGGFTLEDTSAETVFWIGDTMAEEGVRVFAFVPVPSGVDRAMDLQNFEVRSIALLDQLLRGGAPLDWACPVRLTGDEAYGDQVQFHFINDRIGQFGD